jgi:hypothetical protein
VDNDSLHDDDDSNDEPEGNIPWNEYFSCISELYLQKQLYNDVNNFCHFGA